MVLITGHRRENFGENFAAICRAIAELANCFQDVDFVYPVHLNPNVRAPVHALLKGRDNVHLLEPATYPEFVWLMDRSDLILTDSGGVQEEAPSLKKPVLVMRDTTERPEAVQAGAVELVGASHQAIVRMASLLLTDHSEYARRQVESNPYGDGHASGRIVDLLVSRAWGASALGTSCGLAPRLASAGVVRDDQPTRESKSNGRSRPIGPMHGLRVGAWLYRPTHCQRARTTRA